MDQQPQQDPVALTALVVSLIALIIALLQALQQYANTAEGYKRCASSVIGPWSRLRRLRFITAEFRFQTTYVVPHIVRMSALEYRRAIAADDSRTCRLVSVKLSASKECSCPELYKTVHVEGYPRRRRGIGSASYSGWQPRRQRTTMTEDSKTPTPNTSSGFGKHSYHGQALATWLALLQELHYLYSSYWPTECSQCFAESHPGAESKSDSNEPREKNTLDDLRRSDVSIIYKEWNWDLMPPDLTRPLATSTVSDIILFALRLGMSWRVLEPGNGQLIADGGGYSLSSTSMSNLGLVVRFTVASLPEKPPDIIPSREVDKMLFGVVPGDPIFVKQDYPLVRDPWNLIRHHRQVDLGCPKHILDSIGVSRHTARSIWKDDMWDYNDRMHNELITLLMPFLPLENSTVLKHLKPRSTELDEIFEIWKTLRFNYTEDFFNRPSTLVAQEDADENLTDRIEKQKEMLTFLKEKFDYTTAILKNLKMHEDADGESASDSETKTLYMDLVAAHVSMAIHVTRDVNHRVASDRKDPDVRRGQRALKDRYRLHGFKYKHFTEEDYLYSVGYVENLNHEDYGVVNYMMNITNMGFENKNHEDDRKIKEKITLAWWTMMLRGLLWDMSNFDLGSIQPPVPSSLYDNKTPVWIM